MARPWWQRGHRGKAALGKLGAVVEEQWSEVPRCLVPAPGCPLSVQGLLPLPSSSGDVKEPYRKVEVVEVPRAVSPKCTPSLIPRGCFLF